MIHDCQQTRITVVRLGEGLDQTEIYNAVGIANQIQKAFQFVGDLNVWPVDTKFRLANGGYELDAALEASLKTRKNRQIDRPIIALSALPLGDKENASEPDYFFFSSTDDKDPLVTTVSTYPLTVLPNRTLQEYILLMLATNILSTYAQIYFHDETRGCVFDYCDDLRDAERSFQEGKLCDACEQELQKRVETGYISLDKISAALRLLNRAVGRSYCFVAMPFGQAFDNEYRTIAESLTGLGWDVKRSDERMYPRSITDRMVREITSSDLMIADLTGDNPNVFYEVGLGVALGHDLLLITQGKEIPFDLKTHHTIFYMPGEDGLLNLKASLERAFRRAPNSRARSQTA